MATHIQQVRTVDEQPAAPQTVSTVRNDTVSEEIEERPSVLAARIVWFIAGVILVILAFRFVLILAGANQASGFVNFIYNVSHPFAAPFFGIFGYEQNLGVGKFEFSTLVAMAVYALVAWGIARLLTIRQPRT